MGGQRGEREDWFNAFPVGEILFQDATKGSADVLLVDVGGGHGYNLAAFKKRYPNAPGKLVLQDQPAVIDEIQDLDEGIMRMEHNFFSPQLIKGKPSCARFTVATSHRFESLSLTQPRLSRSASILLPPYPPRLA